MAKPRFISELIRGRENSLNKLLKLKVPKKLLEVFISKNPRQRKRLGKNEVSWLTLFHSMKKSANAVLPKEVKDRWIKTVVENLKKSGDDFLHLHTGHRSMEEMVGQFVDFHLSIKTKIRSESNFSHIDVISNSVSQVKGELLHTIIEESKVLWSQLRSSGNFMVEWANSSEGRQNLVDMESLGKVKNDKALRIANKELVKMLGKLKFGKVKRGANIKIKFKEPIELSNGQKVMEVQFVDNVLVSHTGEVLSEESFFHLTTALEAKTVGASSGFMKQISSMLSRAGESNVKSISMSIEGAAEFDIKPNRLIINTKSLDQVAVTTMNKRQLELANIIHKNLESALKNGKLDKVFDMSNFWVSSSRSGDAAFIRIELPINDRYLERVSRAIVTSAP